MKKRDYEKPTMEVVQLQHTTRLLTGSNVRGRGSLDDYDVVDVDE